MKAVEEIVTQPGLMLFCGTAALAVLILNVTGLMLIKKVSSVFRSFWGSLNVLAIWVKK